LAKIVEINKVKGKPKWRRIILETGEYFDVDEESFIKFQLTTEKEINEKEIRQIEKHADKNRGKEIAFNYLTYSYRTEKEVNTKLSQKGVIKENRIKIIDDLKRLNLINDKEAAYYIVDKLINKGYGKIYIESELKKKGIQPENIRIIFKEVYSKEDELENAVKIFKKKFKNKDDLTDLRIKKKYADFLYRRGFDWDIINEVLEIENYQNP